MAKIYDLTLERILRRLIKKPLTEDSSIWESPTSSPLEDLKEAVRMIEEEALEPYPRTVQDVDDSPSS